MRGTLETIGTCNTIGEGERTARETETYKSVKIYDKQRRVGYCEGYGFVTSYEGWMDESARSLRQAK